MKLVLQLLLPLMMGNVGGLIWGVEVVSFLVPSQYPLVHMSFAVFGNSLFFLDLKLPSLLRCLLKTECVKKYISLNLRVCCFFFLLRKSLILIGVWEEMRCRLLKIFMAEDTVIYKF